MAVLRLELQASLLGATNQMDLAIVDQTSETFLGQWKRLVSTTNWDKGKIVQAWRTALVEADAPAAEFSDEAWSRRVGNVTPQHVGRLRRVFERFGDVRDTYPGLYWSHFQAALDWDDPELWLEGAIQNEWSVSQMRRQRWEAMGAPAELKPRESDIISAELDEDSDPTSDQGIQASLATVRDLGTEDNHEGASADHSEDVEEDDAESEDEDISAGTYADERGVAVEPKRPFAELPSLPSDVTDAFEAFKLCILRHRIGKWQEISLDDMLVTLDALKELAMAPADND